MHPLKEKNDLVCMSWLYISSLNYNPKGKELKLRTLFNVYSEFKYFKKRIRKSYLNRRFKSFPINTVFLAFYNSYKTFLNPSLLSANVVFNIFLHHSFLQRECRATRVKGKAALGLLPDLSQLCNMRCCGDMCVMVSTKIFARTFFNWLFHNVQWKCVSLSKEQ